MAKDTFWQKHRINGGQGQGDGGRRVAGNNPTNPRENVISHHGVYGERNVSVPAEAATPGLKARSAQLHNAQARVRDVRNTARDLGGGADTGPAQAEAEQRLRVAESGYRRQAEESTRRVARRKG